MAVAGRSHVVVLGAGIQGCCAALALSHAGWSVTVVDRSLTPMVGSSLRGEGKIHLGYVYANDPGRDTARLLSEGALRFADLLDGWLRKPLDWASLRSSPFMYGVLADTMVTDDVLGEHYAWVDACVAAHIDDGATYVGSATHRPARPISPTAAGLGPSVVSAYQTDEVALHPAHLRVQLIDALAASGATFRGCTTVQSVQRRSEGMAVSCTGEDGAPFEHRADVVVNCLWHGRLAVDATMDVVPRRPWMYRLKYGVHGRLTSPTSVVPSTTFVLGPFGDAVVYGDGSVYLSWYPSCMTSSSDDLRIPDAWEPALAGVDLSSRATEIGHRSRVAMEGLIPGLVDFDVQSVAAGVIVAWGATDIDDLGSELHRRVDIGPQDHDGYVSIDTGKLTTAPLFAEQLVGLLTR